METTPKFQNYITRLAEKHGLHLNKPPVHLRLEMEEMEDSWPLVIDSVEPNILGVYYHVEFDSGDVEQGSCMTFFTGYGQWVPMMLAPFDAKYSESCRPINRECSDIKMLDPKVHAELVAFCENWADELQAQGWLENAREWLED